MVNNQFFINMTVNKNIPQKPKARGGKPLMSELLKDTRKYLEQAELTDVEPLRKFLLSNGNDVVHDGHRAEVQEQLEMIEGAQSPYFGFPAVYGLYAFPGIGVGINDCTVPVLEITAAAAYGPVALGPHTRGMSMGALGRAVSDGSVVNVVSHGDSVVAEPFVFDLAVIIKIAVIGNGCVDSPGSERSAGHRSIALRNNRAQNALVVPPCFLGSLILGITREETLARCE